MENVTLMQNIRIAASKLKDCKLKRLNLITPTLEAIKRELFLSSKEETMILVAILDRQCSCQNTDLGDLSNYFGCSALDVMEFVPAINSLLSKGYIMAENRSEWLISKKQFMLCADIFYAIIEGREINLISPDNANAFDQFDFCEAVHHLIEERDNGRITTEKVFVQTEQMENEHSNIPLVKELRELVKEIADRTLFYELCKDFVDDCDGGRSDLNRTLQDVYDRIIDRTGIKKQIIENTHPLITAGLVEFWDNYNSDLYLTDKGISLLFGEASSVFVKSNTNLDRYTFVEKIREELNDLFQYHHNSKSRRIYRSVEKLENANQHLSMINRLCFMLPDVQNRLIFYLICYEMVDSNSYRISQLGEIFTKSEEVKVRCTFKDGQYPLQKYGLVELTGGGIFDGAILELTDKGKEIFLEEDIVLFEDKISDKNLLSPDKITAKKLFFEPKLERQLLMLRNSLDDRNYSSMCARLKEKHLSTGVAILLYGLPGTGKTESVMQIARTTGRAVMHVDISATKTCWFGESEKLIKDVFTKYHRLCEKSKVKPILLFNEADAVFSKRKDSNSSSVAQTENAIQNIILEEMENLDGILVATTNLADNLDKAFERRFLFKIHFDKPTIEAKVNIWRDKLPILAETEASRLASRFDFSGGEIDNVVRKAMMEEIIGNTVPTVETLITICNEERMGKSVTKIGFSH